MRFTTVLKAQEAQPGRVRAQEIAVTGACCGDDRSEFRSRTRLMRLTCGRLCIYPAVLKVKMKMKIEIASPGSGPNPSF
jgi:hypothetical protein